MIQPVRSLLRALALATLGAGAGFGPAAAQEAWAPGFVAPDCPMKLTRVLTRELGDGNAIVVTRSWRVRFERTADGYAVHGEQIAVDVDAPRRLAGLAEVERASPQAGVFPIALDRDGGIVAGGPVDLPPVPGLNEEVEDYVEDRSEARRAAAMRYVLAVQQADALTTGQWPRWLFFPTGGAHSETRVLPVPGGGEGSLTVTFEGRLDHAGDRLASARREIVTRMGGSTRTSLETWRLEPLK